MLVAANVLAGSIVSTTGTTISLVAPTGIKSDMVLVCFISVFNTTTDPTTLAGWLSAGASGISGGTVAPHWKMQYRLATAADSGATIVFAVPNNAACGVILAMPDIDLIAFLDVAATQYDSGASGVGSTAFPTQTLTRPSMYVAGSTNASTANTWTPPTGMTEDADGSASRSMEVAHGILPAGATGTISATSSGTAKAGGVGAAFRSAPPRSGLLIAA